MSEKNYIKTLLRNLHKTNIPQIIKKSWSRFTARLSISVILIESLGFSLYFLKISKIFTVLKRSRNLEKKSSFIKFYIANFAKRFLFFDFVYLNAQIFKEILELV